MTRRSEPDGEAPSTSRRRAARGGWLPNLSRGVSVWNLAPDLNERFFDGRLLEPDIEGPENLPDEVSWNVTGLMPLAEARAAHPVQVRQAIVDFRDCLQRAQGAFTRGSGYHKYREAFTVPRLDADDGAHYFFSERSHKLLVANWGASPSNAGPRSDLVIDHLHFGELADDEADAPPRPPAQTDAGEATEAPSRQRAFGILMALLVAALVLAYVVHRGGFGVDAYTPASASASTPPPPTPAAAPTPAPPSSDLPATASASAPAPPLPKPHQLIYFAVDDATLRPKQLATLETVRRYLNNHPQVTTLLVEGHADYSGADSNNQALSAFRARRVMRWLVEHGVSPDRLKATGCSSRFPVQRAGSHAGLRANRRVEFHIVHPEPAEGPHARSCNAVPSK